MNNTISIESSEVEIIKNDYKLETEQEKNENGSNNIIKTKNTDTLHKTDEPFVPMDDNKKDGDKINANGPKRDFVVYGYYVREPIWVNMEYEGYGGGGYDPHSRNPFIRTVFFIVFIMLVITAIWGIMCVHVEKIQTIYALYGTFIAIGAGGIMMGMSYVMACQNCARQTPCNIICLAIAVIAMSAMVGFLIVKTETILVIFGVIATAAVVLVCALLALTRFDFTKMLLFLIVAGVVLAVLSICVMVASLLMGETFPILSLVILVVSTLVHAVMLTTELQMIIGGKTIELEEDDYALGAYMIYTSVIDLFMKLVAITGILDNILDSH